MVSCSIIICINTFFNTREKILDFSSYSIYVLFPSHFCRSRSQRSTQRSLDLSLYTATFTSSFIGTRQMSGQDRDWEVNGQFCFHTLSSMDWCTIPSLQTLHHSSCETLLVGALWIKGEDKSQNSKRFQIINNYSFHCMLIFFLFYYLSIRNTFTTCTDSHTFMQALFSTSI